MPCSVKLLNSQQINIHFEFCPWSEIFLEVLVFVKQLICIQSYTYISLGSKKGVKREIDLFLSLPLFLDCILIQQMNIQINFQFPTLILQYPFHLIGQGLRMLNLKIRLKKKEMSGVNKSKMKNTLQPFFTSKLLKFLLQQSTSCPPGNDKMK